MQYISCLSNKAKEGILNEFEERGISYDEAKEFIRDFPTCQTGFPVDIEEIKTGKSGKSGKKRAPSAYNLFIGKCMKEGKPMKACAVEWRGKKGK